MSPCHQAIPESFDFRHARVTLMGLGRHGGGVGAARWLAAQGGRLTITDLANADQLTDSLAVIASLPVERYRLGEHVEADFAEADVVVVNPAVKPDHPLVQLARERGAMVTSETELFLDACPARVIGVTGSNGKSTTAAMTAAILETDGRRAWLGGNIGRSLLAEVGQIHADDVVVLEISSFQLHWLSENARGPHVAIVTNCTPNHLDWHGDNEHYALSKQRLLSLLADDGVAVLNPADSEVAGWRDIVCGRVVAPVEEGCLPSLKVPGRHNRLNASLAAAAARAVGCSDDAIGCGLSDFKGLPHRLEFVAEIEGRRYYNDSKATTPEAAIAALQSFSTPVWLLAGGYAKGGNYAALGASVTSPARGAALFGAAGPLLADLILQHSPSAKVWQAATLDEALASIRSRSRPGDSILLSPACASFDQFADYAARGDQFVRLVTGMRR